jgi:SNF2 family DNA or RNA helicase
LTITIAACCSFLRRNREVAEHLSSVVLFDGHLLIDTATELYEVPQAVIAALSPAVLVHVEADPSLIAARRNADTQRKRPERDIDTLAAHQARSRQLCQDCALTLGIPMHIIGSSDVGSLGDLWSLFDFINPGLLGTAKEFTTFTKRLADSGQNAGNAPGAAKADYGPLRSLVRPYILRRMKSDKSIIADLPDKSEVKTFCTLSKRQAALYQETVAELAERLKEVDGIQRKGLVLATLMRLKQICNHPSQWLGDGGWKEADSGKLVRLAEIIEEIASRQEKVLVFTQFKEITAQLASLLGRAFGRDGLVLTGETAVAKRRDLVRRFQEDEQIPFFVLSLKAGGAGLNLTAASHVVHFDRWWNPAVENQATDRAFRIGQKRNVLVHKFVCRGTVEDRIDQMIDEKAKLAGDILSGGAETLLTEMKDDELLSLVALDLASAQKED